MPASLSRLSWSAPHPALPHGASGGACLLLGLPLILSSLRGHLHIASSPPLLASYTLAALANAIAGGMITRRAQRAFQPIFRRAALFQCCLLYYVVRFSPFFPTGGVELAGVLAMATALGVGIGSGLGLGLGMGLGVGAGAGVGVGVGLILDGAVAAKALFALDAGFCALCWLAILSFVQVSFAMPAAIRIALLFGSAALSLLASYPLQLALLGSEWWECVRATYPVQDVAMVSYIYVPTTWAFALMLFGATLWNRKIIGELAFGGGFAGLVLVSVASTVIMQEVHIPEPASTQKLWLPCPAPPPDSWSAWAVAKLDMSFLARYVIQWFASD